MVELKMPRVAENVEEVSISKWLVLEGEKIEKGQPVAEVLFDKVTQVIDSPIDGFLKSILVTEGEVVKVDNPIAVFVQELKDVQEEQDRKTAGTISETIKNEKRKIDEEKGVEETESRIKVSPVARMLAKEKEIDLREIKGRGPNGRIVLKDVKESHEKRNESKMYETYQTLELQGLRKVIAERMTQSYRNAPHVTIIMRADVSKVQDFLNDLKKREKKVSLTSVITKATAAALNEYSTFKTLIKDNAIVEDTQTNIGVAVDLGGGLVVPVISNVDQKGLIEIDKELKDLIQSVKEDKLNSDKISRGSFTISNLGMYDVEEFTPIINPPQCAILGVGKVVEKLVMESGYIVTKPEITLSLSFDHRIADGVLAAKFLKAIKSLLEDPLMLVL